MTEINVPEGSWIKLLEAFRLTELKVRSKERANSLLLDALSTGKIAASGDPVRQGTGDVGYRNIHLRTDEFVKWLLGVRA